MIDDGLLAWSSDFACHLNFMPRVRADFEAQHHPNSPAVFIGTASGLREASGAELTAPVKFDFGREAAER